MSDTHESIIAETYQDFFKEVLENAYKMTGFLDKVIVWLIGFSTGAITIIISSIDKLPFDKCSIRITIYLFGFSILLGIVGRILMAIATYIGLKLYASYNINIRIASLANKLEEVLVTSEQTNEILTNQALAKIQIIAERSFGFKDGYYKNKKVKSNLCKGRANRILTYSGYGLYIFSALLFIVAIFYFIYQF